MKIASHLSALILALSFFASAYAHADMGTGMESGPGGNPENKTSYGAEKKYNINFEPVLALVGYVDLSMDFKISENWTLGPEISYWHTSVGSGDPTYTDNISLTAFAFGARGNWCPTGVFQDGWYLSPILEYMNVRATTTSNGQALSALVSEIAITGLGGYQWFWNSFNMRLGGGLTLATGPSKIHVQTSNSTYSNDVDYNPNSLGFAVDFMIGWSF